MYKFFLVVHAIIAASLVGTILMQRSEGGGLAGGGNPSGLMTARGAADFLTRTTTILATLFVGLSIAMAALATMGRAPATLDTTLAKKAVTAPLVPAPSAIPLAGSAVPTAAPAVAPSIPMAAPKAVISKPKMVVREAAKPASKPHAETPVVAVPAPAPAPTTPSTP